MSIWWCLLVSQMPYSNPWSMTFCRIWYAESSRVRLPGRHLNLLKIPWLACSIHPSCPPMPLGEFTLHQGWEVWVSCAVCLLLVVYLGSGQHTDGPSESICSQLLACSWLATEVLTSYRSYRGSWDSTPLQFPQCSHTSSKAPFLWIKAADKALLGGGGHDACPPQKGIISAIGNSILQFPCRVAVLMREVEEQLGLGTEGQPKPSACPLNVCSFPQLWGPTTSSGPLPPGSPVIRGSKGLVTVLVVNPGRRHYRVC